MPSGPDPFGSTGRFGCGLRLANTSNASKANPQPPARAIASSQGDRQRGLGLDGEGELVEGCASGGKSRIVAPPGSVEIAIIVACKPRAEQPFRYCPHKAFTVAEFWPVINRER